MPNFQPGVSEPAAAEVRSAVGKARRAIAPGDALADTVHFECTGSGHRIKDTPVDRRWIECNGEFIPQNLSAPRSRSRYSWNALLPHCIEWRSIVEGFLATIDATRIKGDIEPMFTFITWRERNADISRTLVASLSRGCA